MKTNYFSFGWGHVHKFAGKNGVITLDKDILVKITDKDPRARMFHHFGPVWASQYEEFPAEDIKYYPRGVYDIDSGKIVAL